MREEKYVKLFLKAVSNKINAETDYTANYNGSRDYFVGYQFLKMNWRFVFVYKKYHHAELFIESYQTEFADKIQSVFDLYKANIELLVGHKLHIVPGLKNRSLIRLMIKLDYQDSELSLDERVEEYVGIFKKFKSSLELLFKFSD
ncbi:hypothetical protein GCM10011351_28500 [Paraliobacillus quinghaiensis]|uniref:DUF4268 domain-containing protein n=1 Tax=Paraliobacillus quinghaiensis TaxID=470815 RepID=A0A917WYA2_9BACI|nr:hypothetical protein [Paraliobacillus quinghaiensis]GGM40600.1 hypothetical protein GCM10011351_28500 [Paraliobacillus quinghaiensis]